MSSLFCCQHKAHQAIQICSSGYAHRRHLGSCNYQSRIDKLPSCLGKHSDYIILAAFLLPQTPATQQNKTAELGRKYDPTVFNYKCIPYRTNSKNKKQKTTAWILYCPDKNGYQLERLVKLKVRNGGSIRFFELIQ